MEIIVGTQLSNVAAQTTLDIQGLVTSMQASGMSRDAIKQTLMADLTGGGRLFGNYRNQVKNTVKTGIGMAGNNASRSTFTKAGVEQFQWISVGDGKVCPDCEERHGQVESLKYWELVGTPQSGFSVCQQNCRCQLLPETYKGENLDKPLLREKKVSVTSPKMAGNHKTVNDSIKWMEANGVVSAKFVKLPLDYANAITKAIAVLPKRIKKDLVVGDFSQFQKAQGKKFRTASGHNYGVSNVIPKDLTGAPELKLSWEELKKGRHGNYKIVGFNTRQYKSLKEISKRKTASNESWLKRQGRPYHFNTTGEAMVHHEFGHLLEKILSLDQRNKWNELAEKWIKIDPTEYIKKRAAWTEFYSEAFAEAWAAYQTGQKSRLPDYILEFIDNIQ